MKIRRPPADLVAMISLTLLTLGAVFLPFVRDTPVRIAFSLVFVLFVPGYVLIAALYPRAGVASAEESTEVKLSDKNISLLRRTALSFGLSVVIVSFTGLVLNYTPLGLRVVPVLVSLASLVLILTAVATRRRWELPSEERFAVPWRRWLQAVQNEFFKPDSWGDAILNILLVSTVVLAVASVGYAVTTPTQGQTFTELYFLNIEEDGEIVSNSTTDFAVGESQSFTIGVKNYEHKAVDYTILVELHRVSFENDSVRVVAKEPLRTFETQLQHNETWQRTHAVKPQGIGDQLRLTYLLYQGDPPANPTRENAYRELYLWVSVTRSN